MLNNENTEKKIPTSFLIEKKTREKLLHIGYKENKKLGNVINDIIETSIKQKEKKDPNYFDELKD